METVLNTSEGNEEKNFMTSGVTHCMLHKTSFKRSLAFSLQMLVAPLSELLEAYQRELP